MLSSKPKLGDIVTLETHPYYKDATDIIISGEHQLTPPLMVIGEILMDATNQFNDKTGEEESRVGLGQCKCFWFSHKTNQFEEAWISTKVLKLIKENNYDINKDDELKSFYSDTSIPEAKVQEKTRSYKKAVFKTVDLELGKKKSSMSYDENSQIEKNEERINISSYLAFVSPVVEIIQSIDPKDAEQKEAKFNVKTGDRRRFLANWFLKVKWFNSASDKFSEKILPSCVFTIINEINPKYLLEIDNLIKGAKFIRYPIDDRSSTILSPLSISYRAGKYYLKAFDYLTNKKRELPIFNSPFVEEENLILDTAPKFSFIYDSEKKDENVSEEIKKIIEESGVSKNYIRLKYKNANDKVSWRTLKDLKMGLHSYKKDSETYYYFDAYCMSKIESRTFKTSNILKLQVLNLKYE